MAITSYVNGAGGTTGSEYATAGNLSKSGLIYYVGNATTGASAGNSGLDRAKPLLTTAQAFAAAAAGDTIVFLEGHAEEIGVTVILSKAGMKLVGEGTGSSVPRFTCTAAIAMFDITGAGVILDNLYFPASTTAAPTARVRVAAADVRLNACQFDCGAVDTTRALSYVTGASSATLTNSRFTATAATPAVGVEVINALAGLTMDTVTFDAGSFEWSDYAFKGTAAVTRLTALNMYQLAGSDVILPTGSTGDWYTAASTGNSRLNWTV